jgi:hypothetical protein
VAPLSATLTHLSFHFGHQGEFMDAAVVQSLCKALPQLHTLAVTQHCEEWPDMSDLPLHRPPLTSIILESGYFVPSDEWVTGMLRACALEQAELRPPLTVQLPRLDAAGLEAAQQQWAQLTAEVAIPASRVVVTNLWGTDLLAA